MRYRYACPDQKKAAELKTYLLEQADDSITIPEPVEPIERGERYENPINEILGADKLGETVRCESQLGEIDGRTALTSIQIFIGPDDVDSVVATLKKTASTLRFPKETTAASEDQIFEIA